MKKYFFKRICYMIFVFFVVSMLQFTLFKCIPGDPVALQLADQATALKPEQYQAEYDALYIKMGLDKSIPEQYLIWITDSIQGDFGRSTIHKKPVAELIPVPLQNTIYLNVATLILVFSITIPLGISTAVKKNSLFDKTVQIGTIIGYSLPMFVIALVMIVLFSVKIPIFPISGSATANFSGNGFEIFMDKAYHLALPVLVSTLGSLGAITRYVRAQMIGNLRMDYIRTARSKGLTEKVVIYSHAFRNALIPVVTIFVGWFVSIFSGSIIIESIFGLNGMGTLLITSLRQQDYLVVMAMNSLYIFLGLAANLFLDLIYGFIDPRVKIK